MTISARVTSAKYALSEWWKLQVFKRQHRRRLRNYGPHEAWTEMDLWIGWIQESIEAASHIDPTRQHPSFPDKPWSETEVNAWAHEFVDEVLKFTCGDKSARYDGNLRFASTAGIILIGWFIACARAKSLDPRRRLEGRNFSRLYMRDFMAMLSDIMYDVSLSARNFPGQPWDVTFKESVRPERPKPWPDPPEDDVTPGSLKPIPQRKGKSK